MNRSEQQSAGDDAFVDTADREIRPSSPAPPSRSGASRAPATSIGSSSTTRASTRASTGSARASSTTSPRSVAGATGPGWPGERERLLIVELDGRHAGSLGLTDDGEDGWGHLRWFLLDPAVRGHGLGRAMVDELVDHAARERLRRAHGSTRSRISAPRPHLYRSHGFARRQRRDRPALGSRRDHVPDLRGERSSAAPRTAARAAPARARRPSRSARRRRGPEARRGPSARRAPRPRARAGAG